MTDSTPVPPAGESTQPAGEPTRPAGELTQPAAESTQPAGEPTRPAQVPPVPPAPTPPQPTYAPPPQPTYAPTPSSSAPPPPPPPPPSPTFAPSGGSWGAPGGFGVSSSGRPSGYPMVVEFDESVTMNNLWGIPFLGIWLRAILCLPHVIVLAFYAVLIAFLQLVTWIPVLIYGRYPGWGYDIVGGFLRWAARVQAYVILAAGHYPPFSTTASHDVEVDFDRLQDVPRWAGIPILGLMVRWFILIPHWIALWALGVLVGFLTLVTWIPVLTTGHYAGWAYQLVGGYLRWTYRVTAYMLLMTGPYPPFRLED